MNASIPARLCVLALCWSHGIFATQTDAVAREAQRQRMRCEAIPASRYETALLFNPDDLQTLYDRSACFQELAIALREPGLCGMARERKSLFFDGSGISPEACRRRVMKRIRRDQAMAAGIDAIHRLVDVDLRRNGNGRDFDLMVRTSGGLARGYRLRVTAVPARGPARLILQRRIPLGMNDSALNLLIPGGSIADVVGMAADGPTLTLHADLVLVAESLDDAAVFSHLGEARKRSHFDTRIDWPVPPWQPIQLK